MGLPRKSPVFVHSPSNMCFYTCAVTATEVGTGGAAWRPLYEKSEKSFTAAHRVRGRHKEGHRVAMVCFIYATQLAGDPAGPRVRVGDNCPITAAKQDGWRLQCRRRKNAIYINMTARNELTKIPGDALGFLLQNFEDRNVRRGIWRPNSSKNLGAFEYMGLSNALLAGT